MYTLYIITSTTTSHKQIVELFENAAATRGVTVERLAVNEVDYTKLPNLKDNDMLYRASTTTSASTLFKTLVAQTNVKTLYRSKLSAIYSGENVIYNTMLHQANDLPIMETVFDRTCDKSLLLKYVQELGGFPIIVKAAGESHGRGVNKADNINELLEFTEDFNARNIRYILRAFVQHQKCARLIVLGDHVIDSIAYAKPHDDFRTNAGELIATKEAFSPEIESVAVTSVKVLGAEFGGVDILIGDTGEYYLAEVNTPCFFPRAQMLTGVDISGKIIDYMLQRRTV